MEGDESVSLSTSSNKNEQNSVQPSTSLTDQDKEDAEQSRDMQATSTNIGGYLPPGVAPIKPQYVVRKRPRNTLEEKVTPTDEATPTPSPLPPTKKRKQRGQNKHRPPIKLAFSEQLCPSLHGHGYVCNFGDLCRYSHNIEGFLNSKPPDIDTHCYMYETYGCCPSGIACRYGNSHISSEGTNLINHNIFVYDRPTSVSNILLKSLQQELRKKKKTFPRTSNYLKTLTKKVGDVEKSDIIVVSDVGVIKQDGADDDVSKRCGPLTNEDTIRLRPLEKKEINFRGKLYLAPLTTVGNLPFRRICKKLGADITCGEMAMSVNLLQGQQSEWALLKRHESEDIFGVQLCGSYCDTMSRCAELITTTCDVDFIDINVGCPIDLIFKKGSGCALMQRKGRFEEIVRGMTHVIDCPLTVKMRTGIYDKAWNAHKLAPVIKEWGASLLTIHGRSREQRYTHLADWDYINQCAEAADPMPVFGNGDVLSYEDYNRHVIGTKIAGTMIARGALIKPWVFTEIKEQRHWDISSSERFGLLKDYSHYGLEHWGSDTQGVERTRRFLLEWLSFLHRYIPVGLLERLPQRINERPPFYEGRDELETLMSSRNCQDWIKISEMLLGPVPPDFTFIPKHKANSFHNQ